MCSQPFQGDDSHLSALEQCVRTADGAVHTCVPLVCLRFIPHKPSWPAIITDHSSGVTVPLGGSGPPPTVQGGTKPSADDPRLCFSVLCVFGHFEKEKQSHARALTSFTITLRLQFWAKWKADQCTSLPELGRQESHAWRLWLGGEEGLPNCGVWRLPRGHFLLHHTLCLSYDGYLEVFVVPQSTTTSFKLKWSKGSV